MNNLIVQNLRYKLERRINRVKSAEFGAFQKTLQNLFIFFKSEPILCKSIEQLLIEFPNVSENVNKFLNEGKGLNPKSEKELASNAYEILHQISLKRTSDIREVLRALEYKNTGYRESEPYHEENKRILSSFNGQYLDPFYFYIDEQIDNQKAILNFILRYKHRSEWFYSERLREIVDKERSKKDAGEKKNAEIEDKLALDLYSYLYDEGINFHIAPSSITGKIDVIEEKRPLLEGQKDSSHRLLADAKVFDGDNRNCSYIGKGFWQIFRYCKKYNEFFGYLIIYNISDGELEFEFENTINGLPIYEYYGKTIIFIVIDINKIQADSQAGKPKPYKIQERHILKEKESLEDK